MPATPAQIEIVQLTKRFGNVSALSQITLSIPTGQVCALLGENGAGKTTLLRVLMGLLVPDSGEARIGGMDVIADRVQLKRSVGYVPDVASLHEYLTGGELLRFVGTVHGLGGAALHKRCLALVNEFALGAVVDDYVMSYSFGMRKKLMLALATIHQPSVLLLDEPTSGLDPEATTKLGRALRRWSEEGRTVLLSTHRLEFVHQTCDKVAVLRRGQLAWTGSPGELARAETQDSALASLANEPSVTCSRRP